MTRNIALIGCGAISQLFYVPALAKRRADFNQVWLVDPNPRALSVASAAIGSTRNADRLEHVTDAMEFAIVATPNISHFALAKELLERGAHVLIEKPFVLTPNDGAILIEIAAACDRTIAINQTRRFFPSGAELQKRVSSGEFGEFKSATHFEGTKLNWRYESGAAFAFGAERTGVIMDFGVHAIDFYHYLLRPDWDVTSATHDGFNGPEGLAELQITANGAPIKMRLSRYYQQRNVAQLSFEEAEVWADVHNTCDYWVKLRGRSARSFRAKPSGLHYEQLADLVLGNFLASGDRRQTAICDGKSSLPVICLLDKIYRIASTYPVQIGLV